MSRAPQAESGSKQRLCACAFTGGRLLMGLRNAVFNWDSAAADRTATTPPAPRRHRCRNRHPTRGAGAGAHTRQAGSAPAPVDRSRVSTWCRNAGTGGRNFRRRSVSWSREGRRSPSSEIIMSLGFPEADPLQPSSVVWCAIAGSKIVFEARLDPGLNRCGDPDERCARDHSPQRRASRPRFPASARSMALVQGW